MTKRNKRTHFIQNLLLMALCLMFVSMFIVGLNIPQRIKAYLNTRAEAKKEAENPYRQRYWYMVRMGLKGTFKPYLKLNNTEVIQNPFWGDSIFFNNHTSIEKFDTKTQKLSTIFNLKQINNQPFFSYKARIKQLKVIDDYLLITVAPELFATDLYSINLKNKKQKIVFIGHIDNVEKVGSSYITYSKYGDVCRNHGDFSLINLSNGKLKKFMSGRTTEYRVGDENNEFLGIGKNNKLLFANVTITQIPNEGCLGRRFNYIYGIDPSNPEKKDVYFTSKQLAKVVKGSYFDPVQNRLILDAGTWHEINLIDKILKPSTFTFQHYVNNEIAKNAAKEIMKSKRFPNGYQFVYR